MIRAGIEKEDEVHREVGVDAQGMAESLILNSKTFAMLGVWHRGRQQDNAII